MIRRLRVWWLNRQISKLEEREAQAKASLAYLQHTILPRFRRRRNEIAFPVKRWSQQ